MKSPYKLAQELSITSTAVYKKIKQLDDELKPYIKKSDNGKILLTEEAECILRDSFISVIQPVNEPLYNELDNRFDKLYNKFDNEIEFLREQNSILQEQNKSLQDELKIEREHNRNIIDTLAELTQNSQELTRNSQLLLKNEQDKNNPLLISPSDEKSGGIQAEDENIKIKKNKGFFAIFRQKNKQ